MGFLNRMFGKSGEPATPAGNGMVIAMIARPAAAWFDPALVTAAFAAQSSNGPALRHTATDDTVLTFDLGGIDAFVALMPAPIPWTDLEGPCATAPFWPEADAQMRTHVAHYVVTLTGAASPVGIRVLTTRLVGAILTAQACTGVYWGEGTLVHSPRAFLELSKDISEQSFDPALWIDFRLIPGERGSFTLFTTGMAAFGLMEIEAADARLSFDEIMERVLGLATYLINTGPVINDGETMGLTATDKVLVRHRPSIFPQRGKVYQLQF
jgi:hypothetical protein